MKQFPLFIAIGGAAALIGYTLSRPTGARQGAFTEMRNRGMKRMMASMPEDSPPKLIMSILPVLREQNANILALLEEQADLLRRLEAGQERGPDSI